VEYEHRVAVRPDAVVRELARRRPSRGAAGVDFQFDRVALREGRAALRP
jgi:hypothetical protein